MDTLSRIYPVDLTSLDFNQRLNLVGLIRILQNTSFAHAEELGHGFQACLDRGEFWVFSQQKFRLQRFPVWGEALTVQTWVSDVSSLSAYREFAFFVGDERIGECSMTCLRLDMQSHRPTRLTDIAERIHLRQTDTLTFRAEKIHVPNDLPLLGQHIVKISDLDLNKHVNNANYAQWIQDRLPLSQHQETMLQEYTVNFIGETFLGEMVDIYSDFLADSAPAKGEFHFCGKRHSDGKLLFTARMQFG